MRTARRLAAGLAALGVLASALLLAADPLLAVDVVLMTGRHDPSEVETWRALRDARDDPVEMYGTPLPGGARRLVLLPPPGPGALLEVPEVPGRRLLFVDEHSGLHLVDARALRGPAIAAGLLALGAVVLLRRTRARKA